MIRTNTTTYDTAGRETGESMSSTVGTAVPDVTTTYKPDTGLLATSTAAGRTISRSTTHSAD